MKISRLSRPGLLLLLAVLLAVSGCASIKRMFSPATAGTGEAALAYYGEAMARLKTGQNERAAELLHKAIKHDPGLYYAYYPLGQIYKDMGRPDKARRTWELGLAQIKETNQRKEYPGPRAAAEIRAALAGLAGPQGMQELRPRPRPASPPPVLKPRPAKAAKPMARPRPASKAKPMAKPMAKPKAKPKAKPAMAAKSAHKGAYAVVVSSNLKMASAMQDRDRLKKKGVSALISTHKNKGKTWYRVWVGCCTTLKEAKVLASRVKRQKLAKSAVPMRYPQKAAK